MAKCRKCNRPIIFLSERPEFINVGTFANPKGVFTKPKLLPIDPDPNPDGNIAIYEYPPNLPGGGRSTRPKSRYFRRLEGYLKFFYQRAGGIVYSIHFDTCRGYGPIGRY